MKRFVILGHKVPLEGTFTLNDLPGAAGRVDVICRAIGSSLFLSHGIRRDVEAVAVLQDAIQIRIPGDRVKRLNPDERSTAALIKHALAATPEDDEEVMSTPGIFVSRSSLEGALDRLYQLEAHPILLHESGQPAESFTFPANPAFILSDHQEFTDAEMETLGDLPRLSLGARSLHTSQCITILHYLMDGQEALDEMELVLCHKVWGEPKALLIKGLLEDCGIPVNLVSHVPPSVFPTVLDGLSEVQLMVRPLDLDRAREIISDYFEDPVTE